jgi:hypothetical protein
MVANFRCNELKEESIELVKEPCFILKEDSEKGVLNNFAERCWEIMKMATAHYDEFAHQYE